MNRRHRKILINGNIISGSKTAEYLMIPRVVEQGMIPPVEFSYFNPTKKKYVTLRSKII